MQSAIKAEIKRLAKKTLDKQARLEAIEAQYRERYTKRTGRPAGVPSPKKSNYVGNHFDPKYCARNANFLAKTIWYKILQGTYEPQPAIHYQIPKPDGGKRSIMAFSLPDSALANVVLRRTRDRNLKRLSPSSYAYHPDKNVFDAILALRDFRHDGQFFAVQIDFEKYFDNIPLWYIEDKIRDPNLISLTPQERHVFGQFLRHKYHDFLDYGIGKSERRHKGTPQGSSVSLLLANLANHDLDTALSEQAGKFVRFADDVVALCRNYQNAHAIQECFIQHCKNSGLIINQRKSPGIAIISGSDRELRTYPQFDYLGYRFTPSGLTVPEKIEKRVKSRISRLINIYLLQYIGDGFNPHRASTVAPVFDWDLLGLLYEIRRYLYGGLSERDLHDFIHNGNKLPHMKGLMGFYCLLEDKSALRRIDGWLLSTIRRAMVARSKILKSKHNCDCPTPTRRSLATGEWLDLGAWRGDQYPETQVPSLVRGWRSARKYFYTFGLEKVQAPTYLAYGSQSFEKFELY